jgi:hypothetical protein
MQGAKFPSTRFLTKTVKRNSEVTNIEFKAQCEYTTFTNLDETESRRCIW